MRLQVAVKRHTLPAVNIVFNTASSRSPINTVADLLAAVDQVVPLESADGEWGLEDYVVETAAASHRGLHYECLHYQLVSEVLKEDDEVLIRGLSTDEIRERRQGGRLQILPDGRHLFDGVAWGRRYNSHVQRPGIQIPPRKRRRLLVSEEEQSTENDASFALVLSDNPAQAEAVGNSDDENEDEEYEEYEDDSTSEDELSDAINDEDDASEMSDDSEGRPLQIVSRLEFDDVDAGSDEDEAHSDPDDVPTEGLEEGELQLLLREAEEVEDAYNSLPLEVRIKSPPRKRKRGDLDGVAIEETTFEGFSSPLEQRIIAGSDEQVNGTIQGVIGDHIVSEPPSDHLHANPSIASVKDLELPSSASLQIGGEGDQEEAVSSEALSLADDISSQISEDDAESGADSSSSTGAESDDSTSSSGADSSDFDSDDSDSTSDSDDASSSSESDSDANSDSDSEASASSVETSPKPLKHSSALNSVELIAKARTDNPPGTGTRRTKTNNNRAKRRKRLENLKAQGILPPEADFESLRAYEENQQQEGDHLPEDATTSNINNDGGRPLKSTSLDQNSSLEAGLTRKKEEMLARFNAVYENETLVANAGVVNTPVDIQVMPSQPLDAVTESPKEDPVNLSTATDGNVSPLKLPQKRARLDVESSRRMLFSSLGLRNPKTPAAEQALREKLSQPARNVLTRPVEQMNINATEVDDDSWKEKLIISAIECVQGGLVLSPPPFPFKQHWHKTDWNEKGGFSKDHNQDQDEPTNNQTSERYVQPLPVIPKSLTDSRTISAGTADMDDIPRPTDLDSYPSLTANDVRVGAVIAYKHLHINQKFEPEESPYQVARIISLNSGESGDMIEMLLSKKDRERSKASEFDTETGERMFSKFEMPIEEDEYDDTGLRELTFDELINPKLILATEVQVPSSDKVETSNAADTQTDMTTAVIPESVPLSGPMDIVSDRSGVDVDTPRRNEITNMIKDAGFTVTLDEQLLQPIDVPGDHQTNGLSLDSKLSNLSNGKKAALIKGINASANLPERSSPPSVSMVETVDYPHFSQIDVNQSSILEPNASSSHQDAQRISRQLSPNVSDIEQSDLSHLKVGKLVRQESHQSQASSLASEVALSQSNDANNNKDDDVAQDSPGSQQASINLRGGYTRSEQGYEPESDESDSDGLPSLRQLTSSQKQSTNLPAGILNPLSHSQPRISPPPHRQRRKENENTHRDVDISQSPDPEIKISASQAPAPTLSQIPTNTNVVDLTLSSDPVDPGIDEDELADHSPRAARRRARKLNAEHSQNSQEPKRRRRGELDDGEWGARRGKARGRGGAIWKGRSLV